MDSQFKIMTMLKFKNIPFQRMFALLAVVLICLLPSVVFAQDPGGGPDAPIDGGLGLLLAAGVGYGVKKYRSRKQAGD
jgi:hypothetical protein